MNKEKNICMTEGNILSQLIRFAIPIFIGNLFQQLYNTVDSIIVGNYLGESALAAVTSSTYVVFLVVGFINGLSVGCGVVTARNYGAGKMNEVKKSVHTAMGLGTIVGAAIIIISLICVRPVLTMMGTPIEVMPESIAYLRVCCCGSLFMILNSIGVALLQAMGDSIDPLIYLIASSVTNIVLDVVFNGVMKLGVEYAGLATIISQLLGAVLVISKLTRIDDAVKLEYKLLRVDVLTLKEMVCTGIPSGIQNSITAMANAVVQANINYFGCYAMAGCGAFSKIDGVVAIPITCFAMAITTFVSQNVGAKQYDRAGKGAWIGSMCSMLLAEGIGIVVFVFAPQLIGLFNSNPEVIVYGVKRAQVVCLFYFMMAFTHSIAGALRGAGKAVVPMAVMIFFWCIVRVSCIKIITYYTDEIDYIFYVYPITWALSSVTFFAYFISGKWKKRTQ